MEKKLQNAVIIGPCHHGMARHQFADGGTAPPVWSLAANT